MTLPDGRPRIPSRNWSRSARTSNGCTRTPSPTVFRTWGRAGHGLLSPTWRILTRADCTPNIPGIGRRWPERAPLVDSRHTNPARTDIPRCGLSEHLSAEVGIDTWKKVECST